jgi:multimeric flavodoxin WrbA
MKVIGIVGSPRIDGTTDALVRQVLEGCEDAGAGTEIFHLGGLEIHGCIACMACREAGRCPRHDDMEVLYDRIMEADALVFGTPIYFYYMTAQMKAFTDRLYAFMEDHTTSRLGEGRKTVFVVTQGAPEADIFRSQIEGMAKAWSYVGVDVVDTIIVPGVFKRDQITENTDLMKKAFDAGRSLAR